MNVALLGHGRAGKIHYNNLISNKSVNLKYIYDIQTSHIVLNNNTEPEVNSIEVCNLSYWCELIL